jgi:hypothetical protein
MPASGIGGHHGGHYGGDYGDYGDKGSGTEGAGKDDWKKYDKNHDGKLDKNEQLAMDSAQKDAPKGNFDQ